MPAPASASNVAPAAEPGSFVESLPLPLTDAAQGAAWLAQRIADTLAACGDGGVRTRAAADANQWARDLLLRAATTAS
jgi:hypothetical protein